MFKLSEASKKKLVGVHPKLVAVVERAIENTPIDFTVVEGVRTLDTQKEYLKKGVTRTLNSKHLIQEDGYAHAVDLAPLIAGSIPWNNKSVFYDLSITMKRAADDEGVKITWGGDFSSFYDGPHYQIEL